jgi:hypothetical protein
MHDARQTPHRAAADGDMALSVFRHRWQARRRFSSIAALRIPLEECDEQEIATFLQAEAPGALLRRAWLPVPDEGQVWVLYEFPDVASRRAWEARVSERLRRWLDREVIAPALRYGWPTRKDGE